MTPAEVKRLPRKDCIIFLEGQYPIYDRKNLPFQTARWKESEKLAGTTGYRHPVRVVYDEESMSYRTIETKTPIQFISKEEVEFYKSAEKIKIQILKYLKWMRKNSCI